MKRDSRRPLALIALLGLGSAGCGSDTSPPGVVLVTIDTCRADRLGCYGARRAETPNIDALAERGVVFDDASAPVPLTLPSHCTIFTGLYPDRHTVRDNGLERLPDEAETLAEMLAGRGWRTGAFVAAFPVERRFGLDQGFAHYDDSFTGSAAGAIGDASDDSRDVAGRLFYDERGASEVVDAALPWLRESLAGSEPFFAWIHFFDPHAMYEPPPHLAARYGPISYEGEIAYVDEQIGRVVEALASAQDRVTYVITADHGESLGEHEEKTHGLFVYQATMRVPWVMAGPGVPPGRRVDRPVSLVQVTPTVLDALGLAVPDALDGGSALAAGDGTPVHGENLFPRIHHDWAGLRTVREGRWKLIEAPVHELYDLEADPDETDNLALSHPEVVDRLRERMLDHAERGGELARSDLALTDEARARLEGLGYVGGGSSGAGRLDADLWNPGGRDPKEMVDFFNQLQEVPSLMITGQHDRADSILAELGDMDPTNRTVLERRAMIRRITERWEEARDFCLEILRIDPADRKARMNLATTYVRLEDLESARRTYREAIERDPEDPEAWAMLGSLLSQDGLHESAIETLRRAVELAPGDAEVRASLARAWEDSGDVAAALAEYDRSLATEPALAMAVNGKALLLSHEGSPRDAIAILRGALPALEDDVETLNNLAWILANESIDPHEAFRHATRAAELAPDDPAILDTLGWAAIRSGRAQDAIAPLEKSWRETADAEVRAHLGIALCEVGRIDEGSEHLRAALRERASLASMSEVAKWMR